MFETRQFLRQYLVVIAANLSALSVALGVAWSSPVLVKLADKGNSVLGEPITDLEASWIVSVGFLSALISNFFASYFLDFIGRKYCLILAAVPKILSYVVMIFASNLWMLLIGRALAGMSESFTFNSVPIYATEIASKEIRGRLGSVVQISSSIGVLLMLAFGPFLDYITLNVVVLFMSVATTVPLIFLPDSPYFLHINGKTEESFKTLIFLRGSEDIAREEIKGYQVNAQDTMKLIEIFKSKTVLRALTTVTIIAIGFQLTGVNALTYYLQTILERSNTNVSSGIASVVIGCIQLVASVFASMLIDKFGRKPPIIFCLIGSAVGLVGLGAFFKVTENGEQITGYLNYLPLISLMITVFCYNAGLGTLIWPLISELFDGRARAIGLSTYTSALHLTVFLLTRFFPMISEMIGPSATYWSFGGISLMLTVFVAFCVPETKGRSFVEIQSSLRDF